MSGNGVEDEESLNGSPTETGYYSVSNSNENLMDKKHRIFLISITACFVAMACFLFFAFYMTSIYQDIASNMGHGTEVTIHNTVSHVDHNKCKKNYITPQQTLYEAQQSRVNLQQTEVILLNVTILTPNQPVLRNYNVRILNSKFSEISPLPLSPTQTDSQVYNLQGSFLTPGLIDLNSRAGSFSSQIPSSSQLQSPPSLNPQFRVSDAFSPSSPLLSLALSSGITTIQSFPQSNGVFSSGQSIVFKNIPNVPIDQMMIKGAPKSLSIVFPNTVVQNYNGMNTAFTLRQKLSLAKNLVSRQDGFCSHLESSMTATTNSMGGMHMDKKRNNNENLNTNISIMNFSKVGYVSDMNYNPSDVVFPEDLTLELLTKVLRNQVRLNIQVNSLSYIQKSIEIFTNEFNVTINSFHHALELYLESEKNIQSSFQHTTVASFSNVWGYSSNPLLAVQNLSSEIDSNLNRENHLQISPFHLSNLRSKSIQNIAITTDHPRIPVSDLIFEAGKAYHYGLDLNSALGSITTVPAATLGLETVIGQIKIGMDADCVVWNTHPFSISASATHVFINGILSYSNTSIPLPTNTNDQNLPEQILAQYLTSKQVCDINTKLLESIFIKNVQIFVDGKFSSGSIKVENGTIACVGIHQDICSEDGIDSHYIIDLGGKGAVVPGFDYPMMNEAIGNKTLPFDCLRQGEGSRNGMWEVGRRASELKRMRGLKVGEEASFVVVRNIGENEFGSEVEFGWNSFVEMRVKGRQVECNMERNK
eukprot:TRINITY_DN3759_c0_g1_i1.p1 TRINITY_DN3759_c0_g1~~TRINITY_DN3759_c0_g1_i1.p1  ORF type:complete len:760 (+),score=163.94 TRINITY_DN3759_c0_g1_i1:54-2333(+)